MSRSVNKTKIEKISVAKFIGSISDEVKRKQAKILVKVFKNATGVTPKMWGNMIGFGSYHYTYASGREGDSFATGFAMRTSGPVIYIVPGCKGDVEIPSGIGPHKMGKSCLYLKNLETVDLGVLEGLIKKSIDDLSKMYPVVMK